MPMPRVSQIEPLVKLCVYCIKKAVRSSKLATCPLALKNWDGSAPTLFHQLPIVLLEEIILSFTFTNENLLDSRILNHIITPQIQHLSFSIYMHHYDYLSSFPKFGNLLILDLDKSRVRDDCLKSIGIYCSKLRSLNLNHCREVTDIGIQWLCGIDDSGIGNDKSEFCKSIQKLSILYTAVTQHGIQLVLTNLLSLKILENFNIVDALADLARSGTDSNHIFSISTLYTSYDKPHYRRGSLGGSLRLALSLCHSISRVLIHVTKGLKDSDLLCLMSLKKLRKFEIFKSRFWVPNKTKVTFDGGVAPLLKVFGKSLETLVLKGLDLVRISTIIEFCPNLIVLHFNDVTGYLENERNLFQVEKNPPVFQELKLLICVSTGILKMPVDVLLFLLSSPKLEHIALFSVYAFSDEVLMETVKCCQLKNLRQLDLSQCNSLTKHGIKKFLRKSRHIPLEIISFYCCKNIGLKSYSDLLSLITKKNWNLKITLNTHYFSPVFGRLMAL